MLSKTDLELLDACAKKYPDSNTIEELIKKGANLNCRNQKEKTPLDLLCYKPMYEENIPLDIIKLMVEKGAKPEQSNCLSELSKERQDGAFNNLDGTYFETLMFLIDSKANPTMNNGEFLDTIVKYGRGNIKILEALIKQNKIDLNLILNNGLTLLNLLCVSTEPDLDLIKSLILEKKMDPNARFKGAIDCLILACKRWEIKPELIQLLLELGMDPNRKMQFTDYREASPLMIIFNGQHEPCIQSIRLLLSYGADMTDLSKVHDVSMPFTIKNNHLDLGVLLIINSDPEQLKSFGKPDGTPLEQLIDRLTSHAHPKEMQNFMQHRLNQVMVPQYYKKLPQNEQATVLSFLECLHVKRKTGLPKVPKPVLNKILGEAVNAESAMIAACEEIINQTLLEFPRSGGPEYK